MSGRAQAAAAAGAVPASLPVDGAQICVCRHGETDWNRSGILQGWFDVPLNEHGRQQGHEMAVGFAGADFAALWTSPLARARETAEIIAAELRLAPPSCHDGLRERNFGAVQGIPKDELAELNPALLEQILRRNPAAQFVGGESMDEFADRVLGALADIGPQHQGRRLLVVTHGWAMDIVTRHVGGLARDTVLGIKPRNGDSVWALVNRAGVINRC